MLPRHQRVGQPQVQVILLEPVLGPHLDHVAEALGRDEGHPRPPPLDERVGGERRPVDHLREIAESATPARPAAIRMPSRIAASGSA